MWYWGIVTIAVLGAMLGAAVAGYQRGYEANAARKMATIGSLSHETSQQTQHSGTPEQERGSDDTG